MVDAVEGAGVSVFEVCVCRHPVDTREVDVEAVRGFSRGESWLQAEEFENKISRENRRKGSGRIVVGQSRICRLGIQGLQRPG